MYVYVCLPCTATIAASSFYICRRRRHHHPPLHGRHLTGAPTKSRADSLHFEAHFGLALLDPSPTPPSLRRSREGKRKGGDQRSKETSLSMARRLARRPSMSATDLPRPGSDPLRPHQDLRIPSRIPSQYLSQVLPSSSSSTPPVAVQIASLHRASEVARFEWRAAQRARQAIHQRSNPSAYTDGRHDTATTFTASPQPRSRAPSSQQNTLASASITLEAAQARDARLTSRMFASQSEAYDSAVRDLGRDSVVDLLDLSEGEGDDNDEVEHGSETSGDSTSTDNEVMTSTMAATIQRRSVELGDRRSYTSASIGLPSEDNILAESQVWDRMVNDLAIGAGISGVSHHSSGYQMQSDSGPLAHQRGVSGGIAASMLALSAAIPRPESQWSSPGSHGGTSVPPRLLPHPIWARRYPGAAGEWLRGELTRRASGSSIQPPSSQTSTSIPRPATQLPRWRNTSTAQWEDSSSNPSAAASQSRDTTDSSIYDLFSDRNRSTLGRRTSNWDWNVLRFPSLDPASRERRIRSDQPPSANVQSTDATTSIALASTTSASTSLIVPPHSRASLPTPPPPPAAAATEPLRSRPRHTEDGSSSFVSSEILPVRAGASEGDSTGAINADAANLVARMAQASRQMAAARSALHQAVDSATPNSSAPDPILASSNSSTTRTTRATQGGMSYIRRLRQLDGLTEMESSLVDSPRADSPPRSPPRPYEVFPWYQPPSSGTSSYPLAAGECNDNDDEEDCKPDPDGAHLNWYQMARERMSAENPYALQEVNDDPNGERIDEEGDQTRHTLGVRRRIMTGTSGGASQRARNRTALVMAESAQDSSSPAPRDNSWSAVDGWTLVDQRPMSPVRRSRDEGSESVTTWLREPANPIGRFSTSPQQMNSSPSSRPIGTTRTVHSYRPVPASDDPRTTRRPRRMASLNNSEIALYSESSRIAREETPSPDLLPPEASSSSNSSSNHNNNSNNGVLGRARQLTSIGRRLEEEFRARQGELRQREERLRSEVARRRMELDQVRRRQGRIGRVIDRTRNQTMAEGAGEQAADVNEEVVPLLGEQESSLIRRSALREPRRATLEPSGEEAEDAVAVPVVRGAPPTPLQEILARISLNSSRMHSGTERSLRRTNSWSVTASNNLHEALQLTSLDDHHAIR